MKVFVACHDAGGAEMIAAWIKQERAEWTAILDGPAEEVFQRKFGEVPTVQSIGKVDLVLCGSSVKSAWEFVTWNIAQLDGHRTAVYLDHWKNYAPRLSSPDGISLPDEVWVTDRFAAGLARRELPGANVVIKGNPYADEVAAAVKALERSLGPVENILYLAEPHRTLPTISILYRLSPRPYVYRIRPHPSESPAVRSLAADLAWADTVVGYDSMALAIALRTRRRVVSLLPAGEELHIPWTGIERFYGGSHL